MTYTILASLLDAATEFLPSNSVEVDRDADRIFEIISLLRSNDLARATTLWSELNPITQQCIIEEVPSLQSHLSWRVTA